MFTGSEIHYVLGMNRYKLYSSHTIPVIVTTACIALAVVMNFYLDHQTAEAGRVIAVRSFVVAIHVWLLDCIVVCSARVLLRLCLCLGSD